MFGLQSARKHEKRAALDLYDRVVNHARNPVFFSDLGVPDSLDGRFESIALHVFLVMNRLKGEGEAAAALSQALFDRMFADMDRGLRETGVGDMSIGRHVRRMAEAFLGRVRTYERGLSGAESLADGLRRNLYGTTSPDPRCVEAMAAYIKGEAARLAGQPLADVLAGRLSFGPPGPCKALA
ncbi:MAG: ubiquinol-cytochrome C chaperone family protein [Alphaproteobacteria bacterium]